MSLRDHVSAVPLPTNRWVVGLFVSAVSLPLVLTLVLLRTLPPDDPKRDLAPFPEAITSMKALERWPTRFRRWFQDHYVLRRELIRAHGALMLRGVGVSPSTTVLLGREGWWYYTDDGAMDDIVSAEPMSAAAIERWAVTLDDNRAWLAARGIPYVFVLAPDKHAVYPEFLPSSVRPLGPWRGDQFVREMRARTHVDVLHLKDGLVALKARERVYHRTDTHWNARGAFFAYVSIMEWLARVRPGVEVPRRDQFEFVAVEGRGHDLPRMLGIEALASEEILEVAPHEPRRARVVEPAGASIDAELGRLVTEHPDTTLPRMVIVRDSFMTPVMPFLAERCSRCVFLWEKDLDPRVIANERPDVVIHQMVGRRLQTYLPYNPFRP